MEYKLLKNKKELLEATLNKKGITLIALVITIVLNTFGVVVIN